ncbi:MAG: protein-L-isoaspartate(D-aspartate) O-methyltransferase [Candidatus Omnitrophica bacterium]|nr:protein-L-isoaspartate(D-aspartate) O-methyltransferase [Candidatus Omnitrophota bacterium]
MDYKALRKRMVEQQLIPRGIKNQRVLNAFLKIERHKFIPEGLRESAYADFPVPIGEGQTISQPYIVALMTETLDLTGVEKVLEIGTGSGYQTAILAELTKEVYTIERLDDLSGKAKLVLDELGYTRVKMKAGDGTLGWKEFAPFDRIIVAAAASKAPEPLIEQLADNGKFIMPIGGTFSQVLTLIEKKEGRIEYTQICGCVFVPLLTGGT